MRPTFHIPGVKYTLLNVYESGPLQQSNPAAAAPGSCRPVLVVKVASCIAVIDLCNAPSTKETASQPSAQPSTSSTSIPTATQVTDRVARLAKRKAELQARAEVQNAKKGQVKIAGQIGEGNW